MKIIKMVLLAFLISGCAVTPKGDIFSSLDVPKSKEAQAYFFQSYEWGTNACLLVGINGINQGCIGYPGYIGFNLPSGNHEISFTPNSLIKIANMKFQFDFEDGKIYYFEHQRLTSSTPPEKIAGKHYNTVYGFSVGWVLVSEDYALRKLKNLRRWE